MSTSAMTEEPSPTPGAPLRLLFYSHDGQGLGHVRRNLAVARAVTERDVGASVLVVSSADHVDDLVVPPRVDVLKLPGVRKVDNEHYRARRLLLSGPETWAMRSALIASATRSFAPDVLLSDKHPLGAHGELRAALDGLREAGGRAVLGLRDILDTPETVRREWARGGVLPAIARHYSRVLVYGSRTVLDPATAYGMPPEVSRLLRYCGYVASTPEPGERPPLVRRVDGRPVVLATAGGGSDGYALLAAFLRASRGAPWHPVVVSGSDASADDQDRLQRATVAVGGTYHRFVRDLAGHLGDVEAVVTMGGYNTLTECLQSSTPAVVVPRVQPRQEQLLRAQAFARLGLVRTVLPSELDGPALGEAVVAQLGRSRADLRVAVTATLELRGAERAAAQLLAEARTPLRRPVGQAPHREPVDVAV